ncbi:hypothetical protein NA57DRAFT_44628 [Rhizodiscina lignyota]|uniref:PARP catalytic domain-containing protein n=1 Tax=Rhizodiscina lignyota TaxID=1504668 RepID=A0A9P4IAW8_9PEZI|nr:hypothetical protein NA57DRAFT_44628 [Rhizodiscina lignyota]
MSVTESEYQLNCLLDKHIPNDIVHWRYQGHAWSFYFPRIELRLTVDDAWLGSEVLDTYLGISRTVIDPIRAEIRSILNGTTVHTCVRPSQAFKIAIAFLQALERISEFEQEYTIKTVEQQKVSAKWKAGDTLNWQTIIDNPYGLDIASVEDTASHILKMTPEQVCKDIHPAWRIIHIESIMRPDLAKRFVHYQQMLESNARNETTHSLRHKIPPHSDLQGRVRATLERQDILDDMIRPRLTFHGTMLANVGSIVRHGFKMPGSLVNGKVVASPRSGIAFNRGVYSSQAPFYALSYAYGQSQKTPIGDIPSMRLFVCATLMGRTLLPSTGRNVHGVLEEGYDAHFDGNFEYIVHDDRAMLPCYVIHLDFGPDEARKALKEAQENPKAFHARQKASKEHPKLAQEYLAPGDKQREKDRKKAAALKYFPYGFGAATGTTFVIEEIGEISDDEEEYGDWQQDKHAFTRNDEDGDGDGDNYEEEWNENGEMVTVKRGNFLDQYQRARQAPALRKVSAAKDA